MWAQEIVAGRPAWRHTPSGVVFRLPWVLSEILVTCVFPAQRRWTHAPGGRRRSSLATVERPRTAQRRPRPSCAVPRRPLPTGPPRSAHAWRFLRRRGFFDAFDVTSWAHRVPTEDTGGFPTGTRRLPRFTGFADWRTSSGGAFGLTARKHVKHHHLLTMACVAVCVQICPLRAP
jgi:hypothetical protein